MNTNTTQPQPAKTPSTVNTAGMGVARAEQVRHYVKENAITAPVTHRAILSPINRNIRTR